MAITNGKVEGRIRVPTGGWAVSANEGGGPQTATVAAGDYYLSTGVGAGTSLLAALEAALDASPLTGNFVCAISAAEGGTGKVTISSSASFTLTWTSTDLRDVLGFAADLTPTNTTFTSPNQARALWLPPCPFQAPQGEFGGWRESGLRVQRSLAGHFFARHGQRRRANEIIYPVVSRARTALQAESTVNESYERFWIDSVLGEAAWATPAGPIRWHPSASDNSPTAFYTYSINQPVFNPDQVERNWTGTYVLVLPDLVEVP